MRTSQKWVWPQQHYLKKMLWTPQLDRHSKTDPKPEMLSAVWRDERNVHSIGQSQLNHNGMGEGNYGTRSHTAEPYSCLQVWVVLNIKSIFTCIWGKSTILRPPWKKQGHCRSIWKQGKDFIPPPSSLVCYIIFKKLLVSLIHLKGLMQFHLCLSSFPLIEGISSSSGPTMV